MSIAESPRPISEVTSQPTAPDTVITMLSVEACTDLLAEHHFGRLAFLDTVGTLPMVTPVNYLVDHGSVVFRTDPGSKFTAAVVGAAVAFEIDGVDQHVGVGWSVVVRGHAEHVTDAGDIARLRDTRWCPGPRAPSRTTSRWYPAGSPDDGSPWPTCRRTGGGSAAANAADGSGAHGTVDVPDGNSSVGGGCGEVSLGGVEGGVVVEGGVEVEGGVVVDPDVGVVVGLDVGAAFGDRGGCVDVGQGQVPTRRTRLAWA